MKKTFIASLAAALVVGAASTTFAAVPAADCQPASQPICMGSAFDQSDGDCVALANRKAQISAARQHARHHMRHIHR